MDAETLVIIDKMLRRREGVVFMHSIIFIVIVVMRNMVGMLDHMLDGENVTRTALESMHKAHRRGSAGLQRK